jgi:hypothetical protein
MLKSLINSTMKSLFSPLKLRNSSGNEIDCTVVTSMHLEGYERYGRQFIDSFSRFWPDNYKLILLTEDFLPDVNSERITIIELHSASPKLKQFKLRNSHYPERRGIINGNYDYRYDAVRFANKVFSIEYAAHRCKTRYLLWLDADVKTFLNVPSDLARRILNESYDFAYLGRERYHMEGGFILFDMRSDNVDELINSVTRAYESDSVFSFLEWNDCAIFDAFRFQRFTENKLSSVNISSIPCAHPFINSIPGLFMDHMKGPSRKERLSSHEGDYLIPPPLRTNFLGGRYSQLVEILDKKSPKSIIEIGTWNGWRAVQMAICVLSKGSMLHYEGYDLFNDYTKDIDAEEKNVKPHYSMKSIILLLENVKAIFPSFTYELISGNTRETLSERVADFAFIDGGHSVQTISSDLHALRKCKTIVLDDYYTGSIDTDKFGCNIPLLAMKHKVLPKKDPVQGGGFVQFAVIEN